MAKYAVFGSSFINRLRTFCNGDMKVPGVCKFFGKGGMTAKEVSTELLDDLKEFEPDVVFVQLGANDIQDQSTCKDICESIHQVFSELKKTSAKFIYIAEICERGSFIKSPGLTHDVYKKQRNSINRTLKKVHGDYFVQFTDIRFPQDFDNDLVHFSPSGLRKYFFRIRRLFLSFSDI